LDRREGGSIFVDFTFLSSLAFAPIIMEAEDYRDLNKIMVLPTAPIKTTHTRTLKKAGD